MSLTLSLAANGKGFNVGLNGHTVFVATRDTEAAVEALTWLCNQQTLADRRIATEAAPTQHQLNLKLREIMGLAPLQPPSRQGPRVSNRRQNGVTRTIPSKDAQMRELLELIS